MKTDERKIWVGELISYSIGKNNSVRNYKIMSEEEQDSYLSSHKDQKVQQSSDEV